MTVFSIGLLCLPSQKLFKSEQACFDKCAQQRQSDLVDTVAGGTVDAAVLALDLFVFDDNFGMGLISDKVRMQETKRMQMRTFEIKIDEA